MDHLSSNLRVATRAHHQQIHLVQPVTLLRHLGSGLVGTAQQRYQLARERAERGQSAHQQQRPKGFYALDQPAQPEKRSAADPHLLPLDGQRGQHRLRQRVTGQRQLLQGDRLEQRRKRLRRVGLKADTSVRSARSTSTAVLPPTGPCLPTAQSALASFHRRCKQPDLRQNHPWCRA